MIRNLLSKIFNYLTQLNKYQKSFVVAISDTGALFFAWNLFFPLPLFIMTGFENNLGYYYFQSYSFAYVISNIIYLIAMHFFKGFREIFRDFNLENIPPILFSSSLFVFSLFLINLQDLQNNSQIYILFIQSFASGSIAFALIVFSRLFFRFFLMNRKNKAIKKIFIYGTGNAAMELFGSLTFDNRISVVGFISEDKDDIGRQIFSKTIFSLDHATKVWNENNSIELYLASRSLTEDRRRELVDLCIDMGVKVKKISTYSDMLRESEISLTDLSISDLIPRKNLDANDFDMGYLEGKNIMVTGAGGSIGSEISRIISSIKINSLTLIDISEASLFSISEEIKEISKETKLFPLILDIKDHDKVNHAIKKFQPDIIYHAAAYKHVPILEDKNNYREALENNFFATCNLVDLALENNIEKFIFVSTDKAVRPTNIMGSSKRMAELYIQTRSAQTHKTSLSSVRFGNVMNSSGSVIPIFRRQIKNGGPVTVTHPEIIRYFMTIGEAAYLVIITSIISSSSAVYMLKMGDPVRILDIAKKMIKLSGNAIKDKNNKEGIEIIFTGLRPGEKLYEELLVSEKDIKTDHPKIFLDTSSKEISSEEFEEIKKNIHDYLYEDDIKNLQLILKKYADYVTDNVSILDT